MEIDESELEKHLRTFSCAAFFLTWVWGVRNRVWFSFLALIPLFGFIAAIILGFRGREWSWEHGKWQDFESFKKSQRRWDLAGIIVFIIAILLIVFSEVVLNLYS